MPINLPFSSYFAFFLWFIILIFLSFLSEKVWSRVFPGLKYRYFVALGVIIHELSHAIACLFMLAPIGKISFFSRQGGYVQHGRSRFGALGEAVISLAPVFGITLTLLGLIYWFGFSLEIKTIDFSGSVSASLLSLFKSAWFLIKANALNWQFWLFVYLVVSLVAALAPSKKDFQNAFWGLLIMFLFGLLFSYLGLSHNFLVDVIRKYLGYVISLGVFWSLISVAFGLPLLIIKKYFFH